MEERQQKQVPAADHLLLWGAADLGDARRVGGEQLGGEVAEGADHLRPNQLDLLLEVGPAGVDLLRPRISVSGGPALQDVRDEDVLPLQPDPLEQLGEEAAGAADERQSRAILLR